MYILKNAYLNIIRAKGRNILIAIIITVVTIGSCITIAINKSGNALVESYKTANPLEVSFSLDMMSFRETTDDEKESFDLLTLEDINNIGALNQVKSYYYTLETSLNSSNVTPIDYEELFKKPSEREDNEDNSNNQNMRKPNVMSSGDFKITAYSDVSYNEDFINGNKKLSSGEMISKDNVDNVVMISEELAQENNLSVDDKIIFVNTSDETKSYELKIIGIYSITNEEQTESFMGISSANQLYTNLIVINTILGDNGEVSSYKASNSLNAKFYVDYQNIEQFENQVRAIGISDYYNIVTNEEEVTATLNPIKNIANFSFTFLIVILLVGGIVLTIINLFNIRERKYEIGVLRAIGMTKLKVTIQLVSEIFIIALTSLIIGTGIGFLLSQPVSNFMLKNEIQSINEEKSNITTNFGSEEFSRPGFDNRNDVFGKTDRSQKNNIDYVDVLNVKIDFITIIELFGVSLLLTIISGCTAVMFVNKYEPNKILQNRG